MFRLSLDKCFLTFFFPDFRKERKFERYINRDEILKQDLNRNKLKFNKFSYIPGWVRCNFFDKTYRFCWYQPLIQFNGKIVCWIVLDLETARGFAYFNVNELYMFQHEIDPPPIRLSDTNYIPENIKFTFQDVLEIFDNAVKYTYREYNKLTTKFGINLYSIRPEFQMTTIEVCKEFLGTNIFHLSLNECRQNIKATYSTENITLYFNHDRKGYHHQFKIYEKTYSLLRCEFTLYKLGDYRSVHDLQEFESYLRMLISSVEQEYNVQNLLKSARDYSQNEIFCFWYESLNTKRSPLTKVEFAYLVSRSHYKFNTGSENFKKRLLRKRLIIQDGKRGNYIPTRKLDYIKSALKAINESFYQNNSVEAEILAEEVKVRDVNYGPSDYSELIDNE